MDWALTTASFTKKLEYWSALKSSEATSQKLLTSLFDACLGSGGSSRPVGFEGARELCEQYRKDYPKLTEDDLAQKLVHWQASLNVSTGFVTGFGGFITMPITIPTGMIATWVTSARLAFSVAHVYGHDIFHPCVADAVLWCLTGTGESEGDRTPEETLRSRLGECKQSRHRMSYDECLEMELCSAIPDDADGDIGEPDRHLVNYDPSSSEFQAEYTTLYDLLGVQQTATQQEIRVAYRRLALRYHPDKIQDSDPEQIRIATQRFQILGAAYEELGDPSRRKAYDFTLRQGKWTWEDFTWETGVERARQAFLAAKKRAAEALGRQAFRSKHHDLSGHVASRAMTQAAVEMVEVSSIGAVARAGGQAELRSSILAGEKLAASAGARSSSKLIPILGALISGVIDGATTASVGRCAMRVFKT
jgi:DnaJ-domain-containing protein 1